jgi:dipicolinate synthase subunit A
MQDKEYLTLLNKNAYILDVASYPHGVDFEAANNLKIKNSLLLGIPSLVAPKTAGKILVKKINSIIGGEK